MFEIDGDQLGDGGFVFDDEYARIIFHAVRLSCRGKC